MLVKYYPHSYTNIDNVFFDKKLDKIKKILSLSTLCTYVIKIISTCENKM